MSKAPSTFRQRDMTAAVKAVRAAGLPVSRVTVDREGRIVVETVEVAAASASDEWDRALGTHAPKVRSRV